MRQVREVQEFIHQKTYGSGHPYILTGDFNVDAICELGDPSGNYGLSYSPPAVESESYRAMMSYLSPHGEVIDLLREANGGKHVSTRPPRLQFPPGPEYAFRHKFPQRLDYVFFRPGGLGTVAAKVKTTRVEQFKANHNQRNSSSSGDSKESDVDEDKFNETVFTSRPGTEKDLLPYEYLSDHWGISTTFSVDNTYTWAQTFDAQSELSKPAEAPFTTDAAGMFAFVDYCFSCFLFPVM